MKRSVFDVKLEIAATISDVSETKPQLSDNLHHLQQLEDTLVSPTDLVPGTYEGGLKTWECSLDLVAYLMHTYKDMTGYRVMELGCGSGLPGIVCLLKSASTVDFQDYNAAVLRLVTAPNVALNTSGLFSDDADLQTIQHRLAEDSVSIDVSTVSAKSRFYSGSWESLKSLLSNAQDASHQSYDVILTSETVYELDYIPSLVSLIRSLLAPGGYALVAAKASYFGCSGSLHDFISIAKQQYPSVTCETVFNTSNDAIPRSIIKVAFE